MSEDKLIKDRLISIEPVSAGGFIVRLEGGLINLASYAFTNAGDLLAFLNKEYGTKDKDSWGPSLQNSTDLMKEPYLATGEFAFQDRPLSKDELSPELTSKLYAAWLASIAKDGQVQKKP